MKFPPELLEQHLAIVGRTGAGKTFAAKGMVESLLSDKRRVCILDPTGVWWGLRSNASGKGPGFPVVVFGGSHADVPINEHAGAALAKLIATKNVPAIIDLSEMLIGQRHRFVTDFAESLYRDNRTPLHLVIDEADEFSPQQPLPETKRMLHHVDRIVRRGRVRGFRVMLITQRPAVVNKNVLTQTNALIAMRLTAPQDRKAIQAWVEGQADVDQAKEVLGSLARLQRGEGWVWAPELDILTRTTFPKITTFDSSRTPGNDETVIEPTRLAPVDLKEIEATFAVIQAEPTVASLSQELAKVRKELTLLQKGGPDPGMVARELERLRAKTETAYEKGRASVKLPDLAPLVQGLTRLSDIVRGLVDEASNLVASAKAAAAPANGAEVRRFLPPLPERVISSTRTFTTTVALPANGELTGPEQRILDAIAWLEAIGIDEPEQTAVAFLAGYAPGGGSYNNPRGRLNQTGRLEYRPSNRIALTDTGRALANKPEAPASNAELQHRIIAKLSGPEKRILMPLLDAWPKPVGNEALARAAGYAPGGGSFNNPRGRLRTLGLIEYVQGGVRARDLLFPKS